MENPTIEIVEDLEVTDTADDCQYCAGRSIC